MNSKMSDYLKYLFNYNDFLFKRQLYMIQQMHVEY